MDEKERLKAIATEKVKVRRVARLAVHICNRECMAWHRGEAPEVGSERAWDPLSDRRGTLPADVSPARESLSQAKRAEAKARAEAESMAKVRSRTTLQHRHVATWQITLQVGGSGSAVRQYAYNCVPWPTLQLQLEHAVNRAA
jgi:hypothetical protein